MNRIILYEKKYKDSLYAFSLNYLLADEITSSSFGLMLVPPKRMNCTAYHSSDHLAYPANKNISRILNDVKDLKE